MSEKRKRPGVLSPGPVGLNLKSDGLQIRGGQFATLAHDVVADLLALIEVAHAGTLDCGNVDENVLSAILRLNEAKAFLGVEKLNGTCSHKWPPLRTPIGVCVLRDIAQHRVRIQRCLGRARAGKSKDRQNLERSLI
jgi:hypothetical protein